MPRFGIILFLFATALSFSPLALACEINLASEKENYQVGDVAIVTADLIDTHRNCTFTGKEPKVTAEGLELIAKTKYKEKAPGEWTLKYKLKVLNAKNQFTVLRDNCTKGGGVKSISLKVANGGSK
jgi:hypothetical protein